MDILSDILRDLRLESAVLSVSEYRAPWGIDKPAKTVAPYYLVVEGTGLLQVEGHTPRMLGPGDFIVLPHGTAHSLSSDAHATLTPFADVLRANGVALPWMPGGRVEGVNRIRLGGTGALTRTINGVLTFRERQRNPLIEALPDVVHMPAAAREDPAELEQAFGALIDGIVAGRPGYETIAARRADIIFVQAIGDYIAQTAVERPGWLRGLSDAHIARALSRIHSQPGERWTLATLAAVAGLSRTVFAERFRELVGSSVMEYVTAWRMYIAAGMLTDSRSSLAQIAGEVGYESEISLSKAFRRWAGVPPGQYRRSRRAASGMVL